MLNKYAKVCDLTGAKVWIRWSTGLKLPRLVKLTRGAILNEAPLVHLHVSSDSVLSGQK